MNDVIFLKVQPYSGVFAGYDMSIKRLATDLGTTAHSRTRQDAASGNVIRACKQSIDLANYVVRKERVAIPASSADSIQLLARKSI